MQLRSCLRSSGVGGGCQNLILIIGKPKSTKDKPHSVCTVVTACVTSSYSRCSVCKVLRARILAFVNQIAEIVHGVVNEFHGACCHHNELGGVFAEKGARFRGKWGLSPPPPPPAPRPRPLSPGGGGDFAENPRGRGGLPRGGGGPGVCTGNLGGGGGGGAEAPFTVKMSPLFGENAF